MPTTTKKPKKKMVEDPLSSSGVSSLSGISSYNIRKISIYKNGDRFHRGVKFVINPRIIKDMEPLLNQINDRIQLSHGAKKLFSADGKLVASIKELEDGKIYVAASSHFIPMRYGEFTERVWKPPSRKHSPIMSADRIKTARTRSQEPGKRRQQAQEVGSASSVQRSRSVRTLTEDRKSRRDVSRTTNGVPQVPKVPKVPQVPAKRPEMIRPKVSAKKVEKKVIPTNKKPPTPKRNIGKKVAGAVAVGAVAAGAAALVANQKPSPIPTGVSTTSSVIPAPNIESNAAEILEFPEEEKKVDMATIHRTPTPSRAPPLSRSGSVKSTKSVKSIARRTSTASEKSAKVLEAKSISQQPTPESSEEEEEDEEDEESEEDEEEEEESAEEEEGEEESEDEKSSTGSNEKPEEDGRETPASRQSSADVSSDESHPRSAKSTRSEKK